MVSVNVTLSLPKETYDKMKQHDEISWSATLRNMIEQRIKDLELMEKLTSKSKLTSEDVAALAQKIDLATAKKLGLL
ncbi:hypothetical protein HY990_06930 [Candidatus Micrarchaeota archaeon]|nr:hypothetical protein [Candidatus Micrarchaeota archaeon]